MLGITITLPDGTQALGAIFRETDGDPSTGDVYAHEPIADMWHSLDDMLLELPTGSVVRIIGPVVPLQAAKEDLERYNARAIEEAHKHLNIQLNAIKSAYDRGIDELQRMEAYARENTSSIEQTTAMQAATEEAA